MRRMPLNPNGKIDKPRLPFPDTVQTGGRENRSKETSELTPTQKALSEIWSRLLTNPPTPMPIDENFFDIGGHSILATRLIFEIRKTFAVEAPLNLIFEHPTISGLASAVDALKSDDLGFSSAVPASVKPAVAKNENDYAADYEALASSNLRASYEPINSAELSAKLVVFLTGGTGFLGSFILAQLLGLERVGKVICLVRAKSDGEALERLRSAAEDRGVWNESWVKEDKLSTVTGDLSEPHFGFTTSMWDSLSESVDAVVHNGALVRRFLILKQAVNSTFARYTGCFLMQNFAIQTLSLL
jgi:L-aminoadipate-semialdehyde dehydrogenase